MKHLDCIIYTNKTFEEAKTLCINGEIVITGDAYHDKIDHLIEGFFYGLDYVITNGAQYSYSKSEKEIGANDAMFEVCDFCDASYGLEDEEEEEIEDKYTLDDLGNNWY